MSARSFLYRVYLCFCALLCLYSMLPGASALSELVLPESLQILEREAFAGNTAVTQVVLPEGLREIGASAFAGCTGLTEMVIPDSVEIIGENAFEGCAALCRVALPQGLKTLGDRAFLDCTMLEELVIPDGVETIGENFSEGTELRAVTPYDTAGYRALIGTHADLRIVCEDLVLSVRDGALYAWEGAGETLQVPEGVTTMADTALQDLSQFGTISLPASIETFDAGYLQGYGDLTVLVMGGSEAAERMMETDALLSICFSDCTMTVREQVLLTCEGEALEVTVPMGITAIQEGAFMGNQTLEVLHLPDTVGQIGASAFRNCSHLRVAEIPGMAVTIGEYAFTGCSEALLFLCAPGSEAQDYAMNSALDYQAGTVYRALLIAQTYQGSRYALTGPKNDATALAQCLSQLETTGYEVTTRINLKVSDMLSAIETVFAEASEQDVSLLYYSGHGFEDGALMGSDLMELMPAELKASLDTIPGRKVVIVDCCYSGTLIEEEEEEAAGEEESGEEDATETVLLRSSRAVSDGEEKVITGQLSPSPEAFNDAFLTPFSAAFSGPLRQSGYYVITACRAEEESEEGIVPGSRIKPYGFFSYGLCRGCGWDGPSASKIDFLADGNEDHAISLQEAFVYARDTALGYNATQNAQVFPSNCRWFAPFRP